MKRRRFKTQVFEVARFHYLNGGKAVRDNTLTASFFSGACRAAANDGTLHSSAHEPGREALDRDFHGGIALHDSTSSAHHSEPGGRSRPTRSPRGRFRSCPASLCSRMRCATPSVDRGVRRSKTRWKTACKHKTGARPLPSDMSSDSCSKMTGAGFSGGLIRYPVKPRCGIEPHTCALRVRRSAK